MARDASGGDLCGYKIQNGCMILMYCYYDTDFYWITPLTGEAASIVIHLPVNDVLARMVSIMNHRGCDRGVRLSVSVGCVP